MDDLVQIEEDDLSPGDDGYPWAVPTAPAIVVEPGKVTMPDGTVITTDRYNKPLVYELAEAIRRAYASRCLNILCKGTLRGAYIGVSSASRQDHAAWPVPIHGLVIRSANSREPATIQGIEIGGDTRGLQGSSTGVSQILFKNLILQNQFFQSTGASTKSPFLVQMYSWQGLIGIHDCEFAAADPTAFQGWGIMWGVRGHGRATWDIRRCKFCKAQEHKMYIDSPGANGKGPSFFCGNQCMGPSGRTALQIVNRSSLTTKSAGGPSGTGPLFIQRNMFDVNGGGGGGAITIAGHLGDVYIEENDIVATGPHNGIVIWADVGNGLHTNENGYIVPFARLINNNISCTFPDRSAIAVAGVEKLVIDDFTIVTTKVCIDLWNPTSGPIDNGSVVITAGFPAPLSSYSGFKLGTKMRYKNSTLTSAQINTYGGPA